MIGQNKETSNIEILQTFFVGMLMRSMRGERGSKLKNLIEDKISKFSDLDSSNFRYILKEGGFRWGEPEGLTVLEGIVKCFQRELNSNWESYFQNADKYHLTNFPNDPFLGIKGVKFKVRDLTLSCFNENYIANDLHVVRVATRIGLLNYGFNFSVDENIEMGNNPNNIKNYLFLHRLFLHLSNQTDKE